MHVNRIQEGVPSLAKSFVASGASFTPGLIVFQALALSFILAAKLSAHSSCSSVTSTENGTVSVSPRVPPSSLAAVVTSVSASPDAHANISPSTKYA